MELLRLVFKVDVEVCARCGGEARIIGFVAEPRVIWRILVHLEVAEALPRVVENGLRVAPQAGRGSSGGIST